MKREAAYAAVQSFRNLQPLDVICNFLYETLFTYSYSASFGATTLLMRNKQL